MSNSLNKKKSTKVVNISSEKTRNPNREGLTKKDQKVKLTDEKPKASKKGLKNKGLVETKIEKPNVDKTNYSRNAQKIRIRLKSFDSSNLDQSVQKIVTTAKGAGASIIGPIPLPTQKKVWCVLKSPHVNKRGGEHYEVRIHKRIIYIIDPPSSAVDSLMTLDLPAGINIEIKLN
tara:strand:- start:85 stop:609 length:525 start_codon:yes stop_codon:yes gene_type:complete